MIDNSAVMMFRTNIHTTYIYIGTYIHTYIHTTYIYIGTTQARRLCTPTTSREANAIAPSLFHYK